jgi:hypothetical protein
MAAVESIEGARLTSRRRLVLGVAGVLVLAVVFAAGLAWAKWIPYAQKASHLAVTHSRSGGTMFADSGKPGAAPTLSGAWHFTWTYFQEVWKGFLVALVIAAVFDALVPRNWLLTLMNRRTRLGQAAAGGAAALPSLMCTCCSSPLVVGLRKRGVNTTASLAYWVPGSASSRFGSRGRCFSSRSSWSLPTQWSSLSLGISAAGCLTSPVSTPRSG